MVVLIVESASPSLRGELSKWMLEPKAGVYVGSISGAVRDLLWEKACAQVGDGGCTMIFSAANEQGFEIRSWGDTTRRIEEWEGLFLVRRLPRLDEDVLDQAPHVMRLWAKADPFHPLPCHLTDVGHVALQLLETSAFRPVKHRFIKASGCPKGAVEGWIGYLVAMHDWGKGWRIFQASGPENLHKPLQSAGLNLNAQEQEKHIRHEVISRFWLEDHLETWGGWHRRSATTVGSAIAAHHGRLGQEAPYQLMGFPGYEDWDALKNEVEEMVRATFQPEPWEANFDDHGTIGMLLSGLIVWADWIASNQELFPLRWQGEVWADYVEISRHAAREAVEQLGLSNETPWGEALSFTDLWPEFSDPRPIQSAIADLAQQSVPGLAIVEAPMGEGKTEAALYLATQWMRDGGGMYVGLPTAATSNQMFDRVKRFLTDHDPKAATGVQLVHGASWLVDKVSPNKPPEIHNDQNASGGQQALDWFRPRKRSLLATYGVGTVDQALMSVLHVKHGFLRLLGLAGKVLIIDEVHAYDAYMSEILTLLLGWCRALGTPVVLLSATLPQERRMALIEAYIGSEKKAPPSDSKDVEEPHNATAPYPLITHVVPDGEMHELAVPKGERRQKINLVHHDNLLGNSAAIAELALERLGTDGCICVIANTVNSAQEIFREIKDRQPDVPALLFHSRFLAHDRQEIENKALEWFDKRSLLPVRDSRRTERPRRAILVATQVVEQSLDLDFDEMITEIAPIDLLLQRAGRLHRHERTRPHQFREPALHIILPSHDSSDFGGSGSVYAPYILLRTRLTLAESWSLPDDMRHLIEAVYGPEPMGLSSAVKAELVAARETWLAEQKNLANKARTYLIPEPCARSFKLDLAARALFEEDEGLQTYFAARTRHGDQTMSMVVVERSEWEEILKRPYAPPKETLQSLMLQSANLPRWWFNETEPEADFNEPFKAPRWLPVERVLLLKQGVWHGINKKGERVKVAIDSDLGIELVNAEG